VWLTCCYRKLFCPHCHLVSIENLELFHPYLRVTNRLAFYVYQLCQSMTVTEVAQHVGLERIILFRQDNPPIRGGQARINKIIYFLLINRAQIL